MSRPRQTITVVGIDQLTAHPANIREDLGDLTDMALSIREHGILQPLTATEDPHHGGKLLLLAGHRRLAAAILARENQVPVIVRHDIAELDEHLVVMLVENTHRRDLNPIERAEAYGALQARGLEVAEIARRTGSSPYTIRHYLSLLDLDENDREEIRTGARGVTSVIAEQRAERQEERERANGRRVGRPKGRKTTPYFSDVHPLAKAARALCDHRGRPKVGSVACGQCWEQAIREDDQHAPRPELSTRPQDGEFDEAVVERRMAGDHTVRTRKADRVEIVRRCHALGLSDGDGAARTGLTSKTFLRTRTELGLPAAVDFGGNPIREQGRAS